MKESQQETLSYYILAGGGTGGHLFPGFSIAAALQEEDEGAEIEFMCTGRPFDERVMPSSGYGYHVQTVRPLPSLKRPGSWLPFLRGWRESKRMCRELMVVKRPRAVLGLGGYAAGPAMKAASELGIATAMLNPDAVAGKANRYGAALADRIYVQWEETAERFGRYGSRCVVSGCPIRKEFGQAVDLERARELFGLESDKKTLVAVGGSQGGRNVNEAVEECLAKLGNERLEGWQVVMVAGANDWQRCGESCRELGLKVEVREFVTEMALLLGAADLVIGRAGASTLAELTAFGVPSILLPYPYHKDGHQRCNAEVLARRGAAEIVTDYCNREQTGAALIDAVEACLEPGRLEEMRRGALALAKRDAARMIARSLKELG